MPEKKVLSARFQASFLMDNILIKKRLLADINPIIFMIFVTEKRFVLVISIVTVVFSFRLMKMSIFTFHPREMKGTSRARGASPFENTAFGGDRQPDAKMYAHYRPSYDAGGQTQSCPTKPRRRICIRRRCVFMNARSREIRQ